MRLPQLDLYTKKEEKKMVFRFVLSDHELEKEMNFEQVGEENELRFQFTDLLKLEREVNRFQTTQKQEKVKVKNII